MATTIETTPGAPLTQLSEEEQMFQQSVRDFAVERIRPLVHEMDHAATMSPDLIRSFFELGIMGIEVPEQFGGAGSSFFNAVLVVDRKSTRLNSSHLVISYAVFSLQKKHQNLLIRVVS